MNLTELSQQIHKANKEKGFYEGEVNIPEKLALVHSEVSEALEAHRKNFFAPKEYVSFEMEVKGSFEDEIADAIIRLLDLAGWKNIDIQKHINLKLQYNKTRPYKHGKSY